MKLRVFLSVLLAILGVFSFPTIAFAVVQSLNGQTGQTQTFQNDSNIIINSLNNTHSLIWQGLLPLSRGGTGASSFTAGSLLFSNGSSITQDNSNLFWDDTNNRLGIGTTQPTQALDINGDTSIANNLFIGGTLAVGLAHSIEIKTQPTAGLEGGYTTGTIDGQGQQRGVEFVWQNEEDPAQSFGYIDTFGDLNDIEIDARNLYLQRGTDAPVVIGGRNASAILDRSLLATSDKTFTFPNASGTFGLLEANQTWVGLNKFETNTNSTIYVGSSAKTGCIVLGDSDGNEVTYVTANDGVLTASATKPSICQ